MSLTEQPDTLDASSLPLAEQVIRLQALLEASRAVHSTIELTDVLQQSARIAVRELELDGALFSPQGVSYGNVPEQDEACPRFELLSRDGKALSELIVATPQGRSLSLYERDFLEGLLCRPPLPSRTPSTTSATSSTPVSPRISMPPALSSKASYPSPCLPFPVTPWHLAPGPATTSVGTTST